MTNIYLMYIYCTKFLKVISCQEKTDRLLLAIHHENIHKIASLRFLKLNLEYENIRMGRRAYKFIFLLWDCFLNLNL